MKGQRIMKKIQKTAKKFIKQLNGVVTFDTVVDYLQKLGYTVIYYSSPECPLLVEEYSLYDYRNSVDAFTYISDSVKLVFINDDLPLHDMLCDILHESAHIYIGHLKSNPFATDSLQHEIEADAFAYAVLKYKKSRTPLIVVAAVVSTAVITSMFSSYYHNAKTPTFVIERSQISEPETISVPQPETESETVSDTVYVTPSGTKFHKQGCRYIKNKNVKEYSRTDAANKYSPCSVCEP